MFQMLITYDLVIADISIDNANVFYELGIRHGLRPKGTTLTRFTTPGKDVPFDLKTDRYIAYDRKDPAAAVALLTQSIKDTVAAIRRMRPLPARFPNAGTSRKPGLYVRRSIALYRDRQCPAPARVSAVLAWSYCQHPAPPYPRTVEMERGR
jgi:hypothetical protein